MFNLIAFDADDTLWHNETLFIDTQARLTRLLAEHCSVDNLEQRLYEIEIRNLRYFGYGVKSFTLSMIEASIEITGGAIPAAAIGQILNFGKEMLSAPVQLLDHVERTVQRLAARFELIVITKGDLLHQEAKFQRSGLAPYFKHLEVVSEKNEDVYRTLLLKYQVKPERFLMVGNSLKSDVLPVAAIGGQAVYVPHQATWLHETVAEPSANGDNFTELAHLGLLPEFIGRHE